MLALALLVAAWAGAPVAGPVAPFGGTHAAALEPGPAARDDHAAAVAAAGRDGSVRVVVELRSPAAWAASGAEPAAGTGDAVAAATGSVAATAAATGGRVVRAFESLPIVAVEATAATLDALAGHDGVAAVRLDRLAEPALAETVPLVRAPLAWAGGVDGRGRTVAVLDTGVDAGHPSLAGRVVEEACFASGTPGVAGSACPDGASTQVGPGAARPCVAATRCDHGTHVAGVVAGGGGGATGVAPGASVVAVNVFSLVTGDVCGRDPQPCARAWSSDVAAALDWLSARAVERPVDAVNLSLTVGASVGPCPDDPYAPAIGRARAAGLVVVAASGNGARGDALGAPACVPGVVSVGATTDDDRVAPSTNRSGDLTLLAPGVDVVSAAPGGGTVSRSGTSAAAAHVSGAVALLRQHAPDADPAAVVAALVRGGAAVADPQLGLVVPRLDVVGALDALGAPPVDGYWLVDATGRVSAHGTALAAGDLATGAVRPRAPIVGMAVTPTRRGYWLAGSDGGVFAFGDAAFHGSTGDLELNSPVVAVVASPSGDGYWLVAADGGVFAFGDARFHGSTGDRPPADPVVGMVATPTGAGYLVVTRGGDVVAFGDARAAGSLRGLRLNAAVVAVAATPSGSGYWLVAADGGVFAFGDAGFLGSAVGAIEPPAVGIAAAAGGGYRVVDAEGGVVGFGVPSYAPRPRSGVVAIAG